MRYADITAFDEDRSQNYHRSRLADYRRDSWISYRRGFRKDFHNGRRQSDRIGLAGRNVTFVVLLETGHYTQVCLAFWTMVFRFSS